MGGLPAWAPGNLAGRLLLSLALGVVLWWIWGPRGPLFPADAASGRDVLITGLLMGGAALPGVIGVYAAREWIYAAEGAFSVADAAGWRWLFTLCVATPIVSLLYLGAITRLFRPQALRTEHVTGLGLLALLAVGAAVLEDSQGRAALSRLDVGATSLAARLKLPAPQMQRYALILAPFGGLAPAIAEDGVSESAQDSIRSTGLARDVVGQYLDRRRYRTTLAFRAFGFLDGCAGLDWESAKSLELRLKMAETAPSPLVMRLLLDRLVNCPTTPANRQVLDRLADPSVFVWPLPEGAKRLGAAYLRFGDAGRARKYLLSAQLDETQQRQLLGGVSPLSDGVVRGKITVEGKPLATIRVGLINEMDWQAMAGIQRPYSWAAVLDARVTDEQGRFEFHHIPQGRYLLVVTGARIGTTRRWSVSAHPGVIEVDRFRPQVTLPVMDFRSNGPTVAPPGTDPGTTA
jgi:hypothetical protein